MFSGSTSYASLFCSLVQNPTTSLTTNNLGLWYNQFPYVSENKNLSMNGVNVATASQLGGAGTITLYLTVYTENNMNVNLTPGGACTFSPTLLIERIA